MPAARSFGCETKTSKNQTIFPIPTFLCNYSSKTSTYARTIPQDRDFDGASIWTEKSAFEENKP
jgi:hypothetical protein